MIIGHQKIVQFFDNTIKNGSLGHSYGLVGADQVGKRTVAKYLATVLLGVTAEKLPAHPDYYFLERETDEKTGKLKKDISVKQARSLRERLQNRSWLGGYQVVIIDEAETLNEESNNALLKILEEPPAQCVFFLLTVDEKQLLPTIRSRCQFLDRSPVSAHEIKSGLMARGEESAHAELIATLSWGRPGRAINLSEDKELFEINIKETDRFRKMVGKPFFEKIKLSEDLFGDKTDSVRTRGRLQEVIDIWMMIWCELLGKRTELTADMAFDDISTTQAAGIIKDLHRAKAMLDQNIHPKLLLEQIFLKF